MVSSSATWMLFVNYICVKTALSEIISVLLYDRFFFWIIKKSSCIWSCAFSSIFPYLVSPDLISVVVGYFYVEME